MRKASRVLCLIGSCLALSFSVSILYGASAFYYPPFNSTDTANVLIGIGIAAVVSCALGIAGFVKINKNVRTAGVLMFVAAFLSLPTVIPFLLLLPGGIFVLVRERPPGEKKVAPVRQTPQIHPSQGFYPPQSYSQQYYPPGLPPQSYPQQYYPPLNDPSQGFYPSQGFPPYGWPYPPGSNDTNKEGQ